MIPMPSNHLWKDPIDRNIQIKMNSFTLLLLFVTLVFAFEKMTKNNTAVLFIDHQTGLHNGVHDQLLSELKLALLALAKTAKIFNLTTIISPSMPDGPNGPIFPGLLSILPNATIIPRHGEINAMDNQEFAAAVKRSGKTKFIVSGVLTDVCVSHVVLSLLELGHKVYVALDSSGTYSRDAEDLATMRMVKMGAIPTTTFAIACELQEDWRAPTVTEFTKMLVDYLPFYANLEASFTAAAKGKSK
jgi:nicotinamidase-related amidase